MSNCNCPSSGTPFPSRSSRTGVVLHDHKTGGAVILVSSPAPKKWRAAVGNAGGWRIANFDANHMPSYHLADGSITYALAEPVLKDFEDNIPDPVKALDTYILAVKEYNKAATLTGSPVMDDTPPKETTGYKGRAKKITKTTATFDADGPNAERYWFESEQDTRAFNDFAAMRLAGHDTNAQIIGPSGFGKTEGVIRFGERRGVPVHVVNCQVITTPEKWLGQMQVDLKEGSYFEVSQHIQWVERTHPDCQGAEFCIILYDEVTRLRPELGNMLFSLLDGQRGLEVPQMNRRIEMARENVVFATANIGSAYTGTFAMDVALRGRFDFTIERPFPPEDEEIKVLTTASPKLSEADAKTIVEIAEHTRILWKQGELESPISTRSLLSWARLIAGGYTIKDAAEYTILPIYTEDGGGESNRAKVLLKIDEKVGE